MTLLIHAYFSTHRAWREIYSQAEPKLLQKKGDGVDCDGSGRILGTKLHVATERNGIPISVIAGPADGHDSTRFADVMEGVHDFLDVRTAAEIESVYADRGYDPGSIRGYLEDNGTAARIPHRRFGQPKGRKKSYAGGHRVRHVVERFFSWLKNGYRKTGIRYERKSENCLGFVHLAAIVMYWRLLG